MFRSVSREEMSRRVFPDFCPGWLYVTTPKVGLGLAEIAWQSRDLIPVARLDDIFVTGFLLERLAGARLQQLNNGEELGSEAGLNSRDEFRG